MMSHRSYSSSSSSHAKGFTLIEILIALVIFSIGLLGMAGMQLRGSEGTNMAYFRSQATFIANDMAERMHANRAGVDATNYDNLDTNTIVCANAPPAPVCATRGVTPGAVCTPAEMATFDLATIACSTQNRLPTGSRLTVTCAAPCLVGSPHTVFIAWSEVDEGQARTGDVTLVVQP